MLILGLIFIISTCLTIFIHIDFIAIVILSSFIWIIINYVFRHNQIEDLIRLEKYVDKKIILKELVNAQLTEFKLYLAKTYPDIENKIFKNIVPKNIDIFVTSYPDIKSNETITTLVELINQKTTLVYSCDLDILSAKKQIKLRGIHARMWCLPGVVMKEL